MITDPIYTENAIRTFTGKVFDLAIMDPDSICIEDIAHGLSNTARFAEQLPGFYSVAQHSVIASAIASHEHRLAALLHDASEAYLGDMPSPFKRLLPDFKMYEDRLMVVIAEKFGFSFPLDARIKSIDQGMLLEEWDSFFEGDGGLMYWSPETAKEHFMKAFNLLQ